MNAKKIKNNIKKNWRGMLVIFVAFLFFCGTAGYNYLAHQDAVIKWGAPDENANYIFTKLFAETGDMQVFEKYNLLVDDVIVPRSLRSDAGSIKPVSFLGIIFIYGEIASIVGVWIIPYLTPIFASLGIIFFYFTLRKVFHKNNALISSLLLASFPPYIYYTARSMFHNVLFTVLALISLNFILEMSGKDQRYRRLMCSALAGLFFGLGIATRTSELMWLMPMLILLWLANFLKVGLPRILIFVAFFILAMLPSLAQNKILYGSYFSGGYTEMNKSISVITTASSDLVASTVKGGFNRVGQLFNTIQKNIFYFGFHPKQSVKMLYYYFTDMFWWIFWPAFFGLLILLAQFKRMKKQHWLYLGTGFVVSLILILYYGSWEFHDNPDPKSFTIGNSYTRYWLPVYMFAFPLASLSIMKLTSWLLKIFSKYINFAKGDKFLSYNFRSVLFLGVARTLIVVLILFVSLQFVLIGSAEGLSYTLQRHGVVKEEIKTVLSLTESSSVIITQYHDKLLFPERKVIVGLFDNDEMISRYAILVDELPVYYYNFTFPEKDFEYLNNRRLTEFGLRIEVVHQVTKDFTLYRVLRAEDEVLDL